MEEKVPLEERRRPRVIAMKGHPGTGKSTVAKGVAAALHCPLVDKDDVRDCTQTLQQTLPKAQTLLNHLSYEVIWTITSSQLNLGLDVVVDSPLSRCSHLDRLLRLAEAVGAQVFIVECKPKDEVKWRRQLEGRGISSCRGSWHKPCTWEEMECLLEGYGGCWDYDVGQVPKLVLDTTSEVGLQQLVSSVLHFISSAGDCGGNGGTGGDG